MPRPFDVSVSSPVSVDQVHAAFSAEPYWLARLANMSGGTTLESLVVDDDRTVRVATTQDLGRDLLPGIVSKFYRRDIKVRHTETWTPSGDQLRGEIHVAVTGAPGAGSAAASVAPTANGSAADAQRHSGIQSAVGRRDGRKFHRARIRQRDTGRPGLHRPVGQRARLSV